MPNARSLVLFLLRTSTSAKVVKILYKHFFFLKVCTQIPGLNIMPLIKVSSTLATYSLLLNFTFSPELLFLLLLFLSFVVVVFVAPVLVLFVTLNVAVSVVVVFVVIIVGPINLTLKSKSGQ